MHERRLLSVRRYKAGYEIRTEEIGWGGDSPTIMKSAYTADGHYIGNSKAAHRLIVRRGIKPEPRTPPDPSANAGSGRTCSIGFCEREQKWYGWSHRAMYGFGIGSRVESADHLCATSGWTDEWLAEHPEDDESLPVGFEAKTLEDAKRMAVAFAAAVS